jgi:hypothetical protein
MSKGMLNEGITHQLAARGSNMLDRRTTEHCLYC